jgi:DNA-binding MarR family transcriptional regulator
MSAVSTSNGGWTNEKVCAALIASLHALQSFKIGDSLNVMNETGLTLPQIITLHFLRQRGPSNVNEIAACTKLSAGATSHLVDRLFRLKLVMRTEDEHDRRQKRVSLSTAGADLAVRLMRARRDGFMSAVRALSPATRALLGEVLTLVGQELEAADDADMPTAAPGRAQRPVQETRR